MDRDIAPPPGWTDCARIVERGDPDRFAALMAAPLGLRVRLFPLYALNVEVARAPWVTQETGIAEIRLQWWRDAVAGIGATGPVRAHEVVAPLAVVVRGAGLPPGLLDAMIAARRWDIYDEGFADAVRFEAHIGAVSGHLMWAAARIAGAPDTLERSVREVAHASGVANWLLAIPDLEARGRRPLVDGRPGAVADLARQARRRLRAARRVDFGPAVPVLRTAWRADGILRRAAADPGRVAAGTLGGAEIARRTGLMWRTIRGTW